MMPLENLFDSEMTLPFSDMTQWAPNTMSVVDSSMPDPAMI
jgi:hypothetical protein